MSYHELRKAYQLEKLMKKIIQKKNHHFVFNLEHKYVLHSYFLT